MDTHSQHSGDLSEVERRLSAWQPTSAGLDADAMLFAAGRATAQPRPVRVFWPTLTACTTLLAVVLGIWLFTERNERLALAQQLRQQAPPRISPPSLAPSPAVPTESPSVDEPSPDSYLAGHRALEKGLDNWPDRTLVCVETPALPLANPPILHVGQRDALLDP
ncbi:MAG TPA: hypothetical protein VN688_17190 [Gemmataceae bacterium]|nr:hypothetical protein [Gemmataceae bacterium]